MLYYLLCFYLVFYVGVVVSCSIFFKKIKKYDTSYGEYISKILYNYELNSILNYLIVFLFVLFAPFIYILKYFIYIAETNPIIFQYQFYIFYFKYLFNKYCLFNRSFLMKKHSIKKNSEIKIDEDVLFFFMLDFRSGKKSFNIFALNNNIMYAFVSALKKYIIFNLINNKDQIKFSINLTDPNFEILFRKELGIDFCIESSLKQFFKYVFYKFKKEIFENISINLSIKTPYSISMENCVLTFNLNEVERKEYFLKEIDNISLEKFLNFDLETICKKEI